MLALVAGWSGWSAVAVFVIVAHLLVLPAAIWRGARRRRDRIAFGPTLIASLHIAVLATGLLG